MASARLLPAVFLVLAWGPPAFALNPALDVSQYAHTAWKTREGFARSGIVSIAQTSDGYLWLATEFGLLRFDGVRSVPWEPPPGQRLPSSDIWALLAARDGSLWIGTANGLARWKAGALTEVAEFSGHYVGALLEDREGSVWAGSIALGEAKLCAIGRSGVECHGGDGRFGNTVLGLHEDRTGGIWLAVVNGVWRWKPGPPEFHPMPDAGDSIHDFADDGRGLLLTAPDGVRRLVDGKTEAYTVPGAAHEFRPRALLRDRDGSLWIGTIGQGLVHVHQGRTDVFTVAQGLSGDAVLALFEDREGTIWVATASGLNRFRDVAVPTFRASQGASNAMVNSLLVAREGSIWFGADGALKRWNGSQSATVPAIAMPGSLFQDQRGRIWVSTLDGVGYFENGRYTPQPGVPGGNVVHAIAEDREGNVWIANQRDGLFRVSRDGTTRQISWASIGRRDFATALAAAPADRGVWIGFYNGGVVHFEDGQVRASFTPTDGLGEGRVNDLRFDRHGALWAATDGGLSRLNGGRVATLTSSNGLRCEGAHWTIEDDTQAVWLYAPCGLMRIPVSELEAWTTSVDNDGDRTRRVGTTILDSADGVMTRASAGGYSPQVGRSADGRIWFTSLDGVSVLDPGRLPFNPLPPPVQVEQITADRAIYQVASAAGGSIRLPTLVRDLEIDYTALSLVAPEKVRFRYRLEGRDLDWQDVGTRRQAFYTDLSPGNYRFRVTASNNSGVWNEAGATVDFVIAPAYYQTPWFAALSTGLVIALVWTTHRVRLRIVERHEREISALNERLMKAQEQERIRIAGELHDGVMQEMLAVTMMLGTAKRRIAESSDAKTMIDKVQERMIRMGTDIRQLSHELHPPMLQEAGLPQAVRSYCEQFSVSSGIPVSCDADENARELSRGTALALFRIVQEGLGNAAKHAAPTRITVRLARFNQNVSLTVSDNGVGFDRNRTGALGGLGLITMRERVGQLNGTFDLHSTPGRGTIISVTVPFR